MEIVDYQSFLKPFEIVYHRFADSIAAAFVGAEHYCASLFNAPVQGLALMLVQVLNQTVFIG